MDYARARLLLGMSSVGFWVVFAAIALALGLPDAWRGAAADADLLGQLAWLIPGLLVYLLCSLPFDLLGGWWLPLRFGRTTDALAGYLPKWLRGVVVQAAVYLGVAIVLIAAGRTAGIFGAACAMLAISVALLLAQVRLAACLSRARFTRAAAEYRWESDDPGFTGGWAGLPGRERQVQPASWEELLAGKPLAAQRQRRAGMIATGSRTRGLGLALGFNLVGFVISANLPGAGVEHAIELMATTLGFAIWSFAGLLVLPTPSRAGVYEADSYALQQGVATEDLIAAARRLDRLQDDEPQRSAGVEAIFHPVPAVENRVLRMRAALPAWGCHHANRNALYLSWAGLGLLARAVHCNVGRPAVWVLLPSD